MLTGAVGLAVVATKPLVKPEMIRELFIILVKEKGSQGRVPSFERSANAQDYLARSSARSSECISKPSLHGRWCSLGHPMDFLDQVKNIRDHDEQISNSPGPGFQ
jgi:hypothetical protein